MVVVNGENCEVQDGSSVLDLVRSLGLNHQRVAVELNGEIVPRALLESTFLHDGDKVEVVHFVGGG